MLQATMGGAISTHAPLAGRDPHTAPSLVSRGNFNPRAPCGARPYFLAQAGLSKIFQPTRPLRGATTSRRSRAAPLSHFNPRAPCGARHQGFASDIEVGSFQPTRPLRGATNAAVSEPEADVFQPTRPLRGATGLLLIKRNLLIFQPTRPLRGATLLYRLRLWTLINFNPRAPCGARPCSVRDRFHKYFIFQPTRPLRGATRDIYRDLPEPFISTHAPLAGRDGWAPMSTRHTRRISTHAPLAGRDEAPGIVTAVVWEFQPTRPLRGATL